MMRPDVPTSQTSLLLQGKQNLLQKHLQELPGESSHPGSRAASLPSAVIGSKTPALGVGWERSPGKPVHQAPAPVGLAAPRFPSTTLISCELMRTFCAKPRRGDRLPPCGAVPAGSLGDYSLNR